MKRTPYSFFAGALVFWGMGCASVYSQTFTERNHGVLSSDSGQIGHSVLVIQEPTHGRVTHSWRPIEEFDPSRVSLPPRTQSTSGRIVFAATGQRDCHQEFNECIDDRVDRPLSEEYAHIEASLGAKSRFCRNTCWQPYRDCEELRGGRLQEFSAMDPAIDWLKRNRNELLAGSIVVIAGVAFVVAFPPGALLVLVPVVVLASSDGSCEPQLSMVVP